MQPAGWAYIGTNYPPVQDFGAEMGGGGAFTLGGLYSKCWSGTCTGITMTTVS